MDVKFEDGSSAIGMTEDQALRIGGKEVKLSQLRRIQLGPKPEFHLADGRRLTGMPDGLEAIPLKVGKQSLELVLAGSAEVNVEVPEEVTVLNCTFVARQDGKEVRRTATPLFIDGISSPNSPADWTKNLTKVVIPDGPITGTIRGVEFKAENVQLEGGNLSVLWLKSGENEVRIPVFNKLRPGKDTYEFKFDRQRPTPKSQPIFVSIPTKERTARQGGIADPYPNYYLRLEFGKEKDGVTPCKLYLSLTDDWGEHTIAGSFTVKSD
jgi:hypothetical protein